MFVSLEIHNRIHGNVKALERLAALQSLINVLQQRTLDNTLVGEINEQLYAINHTEKSGSALASYIKKSTTEIVNIVAKRSSLTPRNYHRNMWMPIGMAAFGIPVGLAFGNIIGNTGMMAIGIPLGFVLGIAVGTALDKKAYRDGRQLDFDMPT